MKEITFKAPHSLIRKIRAYNILSGGIDDVDKTIATLMENIITDKIIRAAEGELYDQKVSVLSGDSRDNQFTDRIFKEQPVRTVFRAGEHIRRGDPVYVDEDATGISDGLGDDDDDDPSDRVEGTSNELAFVPVTGGVSDSELDDDMAVEDSENEAKADFSTFADDINEEYKSAEDVFTDLANLPRAPAVSESDMVRQRAILRKKRNQSGRKAKVTSYNGDEGHEGVTMV